MQSWNRYGEFRPENEIAVLENKVVNDIAAKHGKSAAQYGGNHTDARVCITMLFD